MVHIQWKGKGILVIVFFGVPCFVLLLVTKGIDEYCFDNRFFEETYQVVIGLALIVSGLWTYWASDDYYIDEDGEKQYIYFDHKFMFMDMKIWAYIFWVFGGFTLIGGIVELISHVNKT